METIAVLQRGLCCHRVDWLPLEDSLPLEHAAFAVGDGASNPSLAVVIKQTDRWPFHLTVGNDSMTSRFGLVCPILLEKVILSMLVKSRKTLILPIFPILIDNEV